MVRNQNITVVDGHVPLNGIALQMAETAVRYARAVHLIVKPLPQNRVVSLRNGNIVDQ
ncbi:hypothetical protein D3C78_1507010 [compost metagenome]